MAGKRRGTLGSMLGGRGSRSRGHGLFDYDVSSDFLTPKNMKDGLAAFGAKDIAEWKGITREMELQAKIMYRANAIRAKNLNANKDKLSPQEYKDALKELNTSLKYAERLSKIGATDLTNEGKAKGAFLGSGKAIKNLNSIDPATLKQALKELGLTQDHVARSGSRENIADARRVHDDVVQKNIESSLKAGVIAGLGTQAIMLGLGGLPGMFLGKMFGVDKKVNEFIAKKALDFLEGKGKFFEGIKKQFTSVIKDQFFNPLVKKFKDIKDKISQGVSSGMEWFAKSRVGSRIMSALGSAKNSIIGTKNDNGDYEGGLLSKWMNKGGDFFGKIAEGITKNGGLMGTLVKGLSSAFGLLFQGILVAGAWKVGTMIGHGIYNLLADNKVFAQVTDAVFSWTDKMGSTIADAVAAGVTGITDAIQSLSDKFTAIRDWIVEKWGKIVGFKDKVVEKAKSTYTGAVNTTSDVMTNIATAAGNVKTKAANFFGGKSALKDLGGGYGATAVKLANGDTVDAKVYGDILKAARETGQDPNMMLAMARQESGFGKNMTASGSSAKGVFQMINSTWDTYGVKKLGFSKEDVMNPEKNAKAAALFMKDNAKIIEKKTGRKATATDIYLAHFLGPSGAGKFLEAMGKNPNMPADQLFPDAAKVSGNVPLFYHMNGKQKGPAKSLQEVYQSLYEKVGVYADNYSGKVPGASPTATAANTGAVATAASPQNGAPAAAPVAVAGAGGSSGAGASGTGAVGPSLDDIPMYVDDMGVMVVNAVGAFS